VQDEKPKFDLVTINPPMVYGPLSHSIKSVKDLNESNARIYNLFINTSSSEPLPPNGMHIYADVRDLAEAHLKAVTVPEAGGHRFVVFNSQVSSQDISDLLRTKIPELKDRTPIGVPGGNKLDPNAYTCSSELAKRVLGISFRGLEESFVDLAKQLLVVEANGN
jgi:nucleoside-diphosphate-sugar epimerase